MKTCKTLSCLLGLMGALCVSPALAAQQSGAADLSIALAANTHHARPGMWVFFTVKVINHGPSSAVGAIVTVATRGGLVDPTLVSAPYDTVQTSCPTGSAGAAPGCKTRWTLPRCSKSKTKLICRYSQYELAAAPSRADLLAIQVKAKAGRQEHERALASVKGADDPKPSNNRV